MGKLLIRNLSSIFLVLILAVTLGVLTGCEGDDGAPGTDGMSAYEIAVANGFQGTEQEWLDSLEAAVPHTEESCNVCHGTGGIAGLEINVAHPPPVPKAVISDIVVTSGAGATDTVTFNVFEDDGVTPITGLTGANFGFYIADIVPAAVTGLNTPQLERWLWEEEVAAHGVHPAGVLNDNGGGSYTYNFLGDLAAGPAVPDEAPDFSVADTQRLMITGKAIAGFNETTGFHDFVIPADGNSSAATPAEVDLTRVIVPMEACTACHGDPLEKTGVHGEGHFHGNEYQSPQGCNICHSPVGPYSAIMQADGAWLAYMVHGIHLARNWVDAATGDGFDFSFVTYPKNIKNCQVCHIDNGQDLANAWRDNPYIGACTSCHDVTFDGADATHSGGQQPLDSSSCSFCHPPQGNVLTKSVTQAHEVTTLKAPDRNGNPVSITPNYTASIALSDDANADGVYEAGEEILVTVTTSGVSFGEYTDPEDVSYTGASLYVYGPRGLHPVPVLTTGSTTDPAFDPATDIPQQSHSMFAESTDPQVMTDVDGFKYQLLPIPADLTPGTYMVQVAISHPDSRTTGSRDYNIDGWALTTFQVGTATPDEKIAGECTGCHTQEDWGSMYHRSYFGTDGCNACHDQSGNHAVPITNRVHAVHAAAEFGDLGAAMPPDDNERDWSHITFPRDILSCEACHNSESTHYVTLPHTWGAPCLGCHGDTPGIRGHFEQNGAVLEH